MKFGLIGDGAIARFVQRELKIRGHVMTALLLRKERALEIDATGSPEHAVISKVSELPGDLDFVIDCAGHEALRTYGPDILGHGFRLVTVSIGALADREVELALSQAAENGGSHLYLASGAIGALDALQAAGIGKLASVRYTGRKPPRGWLGSPAESRLDLLNMSGGPQTHFQGTARQAASEYPKNANVAAAVALAGIGFDATEVELIADPETTENIHEITAEGEFGNLSFRIAGRALPDNPRSSALAAMSIVSTIEREQAPLRF